MTSFLLSAAKSIFLSVVQFLKVMIMICVAIVSIVIAIPIVLTVVGYKVNGGATEVATMAAEKKDVNECGRIISYGLFSPPTGDKRRTCIRVYAELTKDPSACELLMPSSYGISCVGAAENSQLPCNTDVEPYSVYWRDGNVENTMHIRECMKEDVKRTTLGNLCCEVAQVAFIKNKNDCLSLQNNIAVHDRCLYALAWKLKDSNYCADIANINAQKACQVLTKALKADPSICSGCMPPVERVENLE